MNLLNTLLHSSLALRRHEMVTKQHFYGFGMSTKTADGGRKKTQQQRIIYLVPKWKCQHQNWYVCTRLSTAAFVNVKLVSGSVTWQSSQHCPWAHTASPFSVHVVALQHGFKHSFGEEAERQPVERNRIEQTKSAVRLQVWIHGWFTASGSQCHNCPWKFQMF